MVSVPGTAIVLPRSDSIERGLPGHDHRAVVVPHARPAGAKDVLVGQVGIGVQAEGRQLQFAREGPAVERLDIDQLVLEAEAARVDLVLRQGVEHERVVGVGAVADANELLGSWNERPKQLEPGSAIMPILYARNAAPRLG